MAWVLRSFLLRVRDGTRGRQTGALLFSSRSRIDRGSSVPGPSTTRAEAIMRASLLVVAAAGLFCGITATPGYERQGRDNVGGAIAVATQECWSKVKGKAQVEWYGHLRKIDQSIRGDAVVNWTAK